MSMSAVYFHIPFCVKRCYYCDFITYAEQGHLLAAYQDAMLKELKFYQKFEIEPINSLYFGGGTPSLLPADYVAELIRTSEEYFGFEPETEVTLEANPGTLDLDKLNDLRIAGGNRLSLGVQSFDDSDLKVLGRVHTAAQAEEAIALARQTGFENISLDFIFGLPGQNLEGWQRNLAMAVETGVEHLSLYSLILEEDTVFAQMVARNELILPEDDLVADMFELAMDFLPSKGYQQYEISNWSRGAVFESRHNKVYWKNLDYLGIGAAAHGKLGETRYNNIETIPLYIERLKQPDDKKSNFSPAVKETTPISQQDAINEHMILGLRMTSKGISAPDFKIRYGQVLETVFMTRIEKLIDIGLLEWVDFDDGRHLRLTRRGIMLGNRVFQEFI